MQNLPSGQSSSSSQPVMHTTITIRNQFYTAHHFLVFFLPNLHCPSSRSQYWGNYFEQQYLIFKLCSIKGFWSIYHMIFCFRDKSLTCCMPGQSAGSRQPSLFTTWLRLFNIKIHKHFDQRESLGGKNKTKNLSDFSLPSRSVGLPTTIPVGFIEVFDKCNVLTFDASCLQGGGQKEQLQASCWSTESERVQLSDGGQR